MVYVKSGITIAILRCRRCFSIPNIRRCKLKSRLLTASLVCAFLISALPTTTTAHNQPRLNTSSSRLSVEQKVGDQFSGEAVELFSHSSKVNFEGSLNHTYASSASYPLIRGVNFAAIPFWNEIQSVRRMIRAKDWVGIRRWVAGRAAKGAVDFVLAHIVRKAFESEGYYCPEPPWWLPLKSVWYVGTCAAPAR